MGGQGEGCRTWSLVWCKAAAAASPGVSVGDVVQAGWLLQQTDTSWGRARLKRPARIGWGAQLGGGNSGCGMGMVRGTQLTSYGGCRPAADVCAPCAGRLNHPRGDCCAAAVGGKLYVAGGWTTNYSDTLGSVEVRAPLQPLFWVMARC